MGREHQRFGTWVVGVPNHVCLARQTLPEEEGAGRLEEDEAAADAEGYGFGARSGAEFAEDGGYVEFGGVVGDVEAGGAFLFGGARGPPFRGFALAAGGGGRGVRGGARGRGGPRGGGLRFRRGRKRKARG